MNASGDEAFEELPMIEAPTVFNVVDRLAVTHPLRVETVAPVTGISFTPDQERSNVAKIVCGGGPSPDGIFSMATLQYPASPVWGTAGLLELTLSSAANIPEAAITARCGEDNRIIAPTVSQPPGSPFILQYLRQTMRISFFINAEDSRLLAVQFVERDKSD
jgi:hypothetical protein